MKMKPLEVQKRLSEDRLKLQQATREGNIEYVRQNLEGRIEEASDAELKTLYYIAHANSHSRLMDYVKSISPTKYDPFFATVYGKKADQIAVEAEDELYGSDSVAASKEVSYMRADWER